MWREQQQRQQQGQEERDLQWLVTPPQVLVADEAGHVQRVVVWACFGVLSEQQSFPQRYLRWECLAMRWGLGRGQTQS